MRDVKKHGPYLGIAAGHSLLCEVERCDRPSERAKRQSIRAQIKGRGKEVWEAAWRVFRSARR